VDELSCPFCGAGLTRQELIEGWCEACGKKLPSRMRALRTEAGVGDGQEPRVSTQSKAWKFRLGRWLLWSSLGVGLLSFGFCILSERLMPSPTNSDHLTQATRDRIAGDILFGLVTATVAFAIIGSVLRRRS